MASDPHKIAKKRVAEKKGFYYHLITFTLVNLFLFGLNIFTTPDFLWCLIPFLGWGVGLIIHYITIFGIPGKGPLDKKWEAKEIEKELNRMRHTENNLDLEREDELELKEFSKLRKDWNESDLV